MEELSRQGSGIGNSVVARGMVEPLDTIGVGQLMRIAAEKGHSSRPNIKLGI